MSERFNVSGNLLFVKDSLIQLRNGARRDRMGQNF